MACFESISPLFTPSLCNVVAVRCAANPGFWHSNDCVTAATCNSVATVFEAVSCASPADPKNQPSLDYNLYAGIVGDCDWATGPGCPITPQKYVDFYNRTLMIADSAVFSDMFKCPIREFQRLAGEAPHASSPASIAPHASSPAGVAPHTSSTSPAGLNGGQRDTKEIEVVRDVLGDVNVALVESVWLIVAVMGSGPQFPPQAGLITTVAGLYPWSHYLLLSVGDCFLD
ncbi:uncharacterized protein LACBIDRAFT_332847 [Laccaria bicolor S238N-H82]|uniref:Predicted protein n=1 Tax=Laccaria bicolor (strain S238N-H82 / ATCC MYA-4686) TaxID=486041 RepID=B0DU25_LACBS|nr:uncharacterized protein LACBIDRAFT_332847 [Laccaria bicolor S238N-H82]EDR01874.1 predicted protein [Laccaria bicolor S238N-H82]|eukprot:XP_001887484.1 predicted protein [Laccaria bicolor S238N-H82]